MRWFDFMVMVVNSTPRGPPLHTPHTVQCGGGERGLVTGTHKHARCALKCFFFSAKH